MRPTHVLLGVLCPVCNGTGRVSYGGSDADEGPCSCSSGLRGVPVPMAQAFAMLSAGAPHRLTDAAWDAIMAIGRPAVARVDADGDVLPADFNVCGFCRKERPDHDLARSNGTRICGDCIEAARGILEAKRVNRE